MCVSYVCAHLDGARARKSGGVREREMERERESERKREEREERVEVEEQDPTSGAIAVDSERVIVCIQFLFFCRWTGYGTT